MSDATVEVLINTRRFRLTVPSTKRINHQRAREEGLTFYFVGKVGEDVSCKVIY